MSNSQVRLEGNERPFFQPKEFVKKKSTITIAMVVAAVLVGVAVYGILAALNKAPTPGHLKAFGDFAQNHKVATIVGSSVTGAVGLVAAGVAVKGISGRYADFKAFKKNLEEAKEVESNRFFVEDLDDLNVTIEDNKTSKALDKNARMKAIDEMNVAENVKEFAREVARFENTVRLASVNNSTDQMVFVSHVNDVTIKRYSANEAKVELEKLIQVGYKIYDSKN